ncbi:uncharacterized protein LOC127587591 [Pristis pectinata]|uniref:uncharacterized protein LOC127587591 n=1 Tax=Pristis pectinata TaxID=685728 RepID=UPI00223D857A|nr:uncharacterized protein LOC127587591 [Pristis pectinata]
MKFQRSDAQGLRQLRLSADRGDNTYFAGESITFTCESDKLLALSGFSLFCEAQSFQAERRAASSFTARVTFVTMLSGTRIQGCYCLYRSRTYTVQSTTVRITVLERSKLRLSPDRADYVYFRGESIIFTCEAGYRYFPSGFRLHCGGQRLQLETRAANSRGVAVTFVARVTTTHSQVCHCLYERDQHIVQSETLRVTIVDRPRKPELSADREDKVYLRHEEVTFTCNIIHGYSINRVDLYTDKRHAQTKRKEDVSPSYKVTFNILDTRPGVEYYYCVYTLTMSGREVPSEPSERVKITVVDLDVNVKALSDIRKMCSVLPGGFCS